MQKKYYYLLFSSVLAVYIINLFVDVMAIDAAQYAEISWEMLRTKSFLKVHSMGADYLDKPPLLFWLNSCSFYLFGACNFAYKLPSLLFAILAIYSTYRFAKIFYPQQTALTASLMLATTEALFLITNDVRTDTILMGSVIFAIWQWAQFFETGETQNLIGGSAGIGLALLAKGPIGVVAVVAALGPHLVLSGKWRWLIDVRVVLVFSIIFIMLLPMCIGLYEQWGWKGLRFYFWTQSFGRITGSNEWNNHPDTFFLLHTTLWAFLPWTLFLVGGWSCTIIAYIGSRKLPNEAVSFSGLTLVLMALMMSKYQLPHYAFVVFPAGAVIAADYLHKSGTQHVLRTILSVTQIIILVAMVVISLMLQYCFKGTDLLSLSCLAVGYLGVIGGVIYAAGPVINLRNAMLYLKHQAQGSRSPGTHIFYDMVFRHLLPMSAAMMIIFNFLMGAFYFPAILQYQPAGDFGRYVRQHSQGGDFATLYCEYGFPEVFYAQQVPSFIWDNDHFKELLVRKKHLIVITTPDGIGQLDNDHVRYRVVGQRYRYKVAKLTWDFINPQTRDKVCDKVYLVEADG